jgi:hypothetical protein
MTREDWLERALVSLRPRFDILPDRIRPRRWPPLRVSVGRPVGGSSCCKGLGGVVLPPESSDLESAHLFVSPTLREPADILCLLVHLMTHTVSDRYHRRRWSNLASGVGLVKPWKLLGRSEALGDVLTGLGSSAGLGPYPCPTIVPCASRARRRPSYLYSCGCVPPLRVRTGADEAKLRCLGCGLEMVREPEKVKGDRNA